MQRLGTSAPTPSAPDGDQLHTTVIKAPHPIAINLRNDLEAIGQFIRTLHHTGTLAELKRKKLPMLLAIVSLCNGRHFRRTGEMVSWPGEVALMEAAGLKRSGSVYPVLRALKKMYLIEDTTIELDGKTIHGYRVLPPDAPSDGGRRRRTTREARGMGARSLQARATKGARAGSQRAARAGSKRAPTSFPTDTNAHACAHAGRVETPKSSSSTPTTTSDVVETVPLPPDRAAAAAQLESMGGLEQEEIQNLVGLEGATRENVLAWIIESKKPHIKNPPGFVRDRLLNLKKPPPKALSEARRQLEREKRIAAVASVPAREPTAAELAARAEADAKSAAAGAEFQAKYAARKAAKESSHG